MLIARHVRRKVESIADTTFGRFRSAAEEYGTLSAEELLAIGASLFMRIAVEPLEKMSHNPKEMRRQLCAQLIKIVKQDDDDVVN